MKISFWAVCFAVLIAGCSAHNIFNVETRVTIKPLTTTQFPPYSGHVFVTQMPLTKEIQAEPIANIDVGTVTTRSPFDVMHLLADRARQLGANAVFDVKVWKQMSGFSPQAPQASGTAVRVVGTNVLTGLSGAWY